MLTIKLDSKNGHRAYLGGAMIVKLESFEEVATLTFFWDIYKGINYDYEL